MNIHNSKKKKLMPVHINSVNPISRYSRFLVIRCTIRRTSILVSIPHFLGMLTQSTILLVQSNFLAFCYSYMVIWYPKTIMVISLKDNTSLPPNILPSSLQTHMRTSLQYSAYTEDQIPKAIIMQLAGYVLTED